MNLLDLHFPAEYQSVLCCAVEQTIRHVDLGWAGVTYLLFFQVNMNHLGQHPQPNLDNTPVGKNPPGLPHPTAHRY